MKPIHTFLAFSLIGTVAMAQSNLLRGDSNFLAKAAQGGQGEVELGQLAQQRGTNPKVKEFGWQMETDHSKANDQLKSLASSKGLTVPTSIDSDSHATKAKLSRLSGAEFDRAYMQAMVEDHKKDIIEFQKEASSGSDAD